MTKKDLIEYLTKRIELSEKLSKAAAAVPLATNDSFESDTLSSKERQARYLGKKAAFEEALGLVETLEE